MTKVKILFILKEKYFDQKNENFVNFDVILQIDIVVISKSSQNVKI